MSADRCQGCKQDPPAVRVRFPYTGRAYDVCDRCAQRAVDLDGVSIVALVGRP